MVGVKPVVALKTNKSHIKSILKCTDRDVITVAGVCKQASRCIQDDLHMFL